MHIPTLADIPAPVWSTVDGLDNIDILRIPGEPLAALPCNGRRSSARWQVFDVARREAGCQLTSREVRGWLVRAAHGRAMQELYAADRARNQAERDAKAKAIRAERRERRAAQLEMFA